MFVSETDDEFVTSSGTGSGSGAGSASSPGSGSRFGSGNPSPFDSFAHASAFQSRSQPQSKPFVGEKTADRTAFSADQASVVPLLAYDLLNYYYLCSDYIVNY